ncbi:MULTISPECIES: YibE/F family protein [Vagococcus]|uniref:Uncharacterized protein n=1 Tax=Vagococcus fluvialis bH819 TaxID=1255619 RepID=A0A1X6WQC3_9ENTE|nr:MULTISPECIES: YibE/F family protein [Vagococcus]SLM86467.1 hypothetical protein FM121_10270 [Vagococcus fluvialis bH819]
MFNLNRNKKYLLLIVLLITILLVYFSFQFDNYQQPIGKIVSEEVISTSKQVDEHGNTDNLTEQLLTVELLNSKDKGKHLEILNNYSNSQIKNHVFHKKEIVFLHLSKNNHSLSANIEELKRDSYLIILSAFLISLLILFNGFHGLKILISFLLNASILIFLFLIYRHSNSNLLFLFFLIAIPLLVTLTFLITNGWNTKTKIAIFSTLTGSLLTFSIGYITIACLSHQGLHYEEMELVTRPPHLLFLSSLLIGSVGAVMDVSMTIISSLMELVQIKKELTLKELHTFGKKIGEDIMGPMINIMFFSYLSGSIPLILIFLRNEMSLSYTFSITLSLELARALIGSIGIILAIPVSIWTTSFFLKKGNLL